MDQAQPRQDGMALPAALMAMLVLVMLAGLFVRYATTEQRATRASQTFETGLHVAESAAELAIAALADPDQPQQPMVASTSAPDDELQARQWAIDLALGEVTATCDRFERTAGGDGIAIVDDGEGMIYGVSFLPDCQRRETTRVLRMAFDTRPTVPYPAGVTILTGGNIHFDGNAKVDGGIHANGNIINGPHQASGPVTAGGSCASAHSSCVDGAGIRSIPNFTARRFWDIRNEPAVNPNNDPFYELCPDGKAYINSQDEPCDGDEVSIHPGWKFTTTSPPWRTGAATWGPTWKWDQNYGPPDGIYYAYQANVISADNSGQGTSSRFTVMAEADLIELKAGNGSHSGSIRFTGNPKFYASWPGVGVVADVDVIVENNISAFGSTTMVFAREQFQFTQNGKSERMFFVACNVSLTSTDYDSEAPNCEHGGTPSSTLASPIDTTRIVKNTDFDAPGDGAAVTPNLGITGVADWETL
jgi:hypothetical protein